MGLRNAQVVIVLDYFLYFDELLDLASDLFDLLLLLSEALTTIFATQFTAATCVVPEGTVVGVGAVDATPVGELCCVRGSVLPRLHWRGGIGLIEVLDILQVVHQVLIIVDLTLCGTLMQEDSNISSELTVLCQLNVDILSLVLKGLFELL